MQLVSDYSQYADLQEIKNAYRAKVNEIYIVIM